MKKPWIILALVLVGAGCSSKEETSSTPLSESLDADHPVQHFVKNRLTEEQRTQWEKIQNEGIGKRRATRSIGDIRKRMAEMKKATDEMADRLRKLMGNELYEDYMVAYRAQMEKVQQRFREKAAKEKDGKK